MESGTLIKKLIKSGKNAELWTENSDSKKKQKQKASKEDETASDVDEKKTEPVENPAKDNGNGKENQKGQLEKEGDDTSGDEHTEVKGSAPEVAAQSGGGGGKKKKKKKKKGNAGSTNAGGAPAAGSSGSPPPTGITGPPIDQMNLNPPRQHIFSYPQFYYPAPEYGMSYNTAPPTASMTTSYYTLPLHSYTNLRPHYYPPPPPSDPIMDINRYDNYHGDDEPGCSIM